MKNFLRLVISFLYVYEWIVFLTLFVKQANVFTDESKTTSPSTTNRVRMQSIVIQQYFPTGRIFFEKGSRPCLGNRVASFLFFSLFFLLLWQPVEIHGKQRCNLLKSYESFHRFLFSFLFLFFFFGLFLLTFLFFRNWFIGNDVWKFFQPIYINTSLFKDEEEKNFA